MTALAAGVQAVPAPYAIDFALIVIAGNRTRFEMLRTAVDEDPTVRPRWTPIRTWVDKDWLRFLPGSIRIRARHLLDSRAVFASAPDAIVIHAFETYALYMLWHRLRRLDTVVAWSSDGPPPLVGGGLGAWARRHAVRRTDLFLPFSRFASAGLFERYPDVDPDRVQVLNPGLDLEQWSLRAPRRPDGRFRLLFVGGEAERKGLPTLVDAFERDLADRCSLHVLTQAFGLPAELRERMRRMPNVVVDLDRRATPDVYEAADAFVLPTNFDLSPWVSMEAMATGVPVIATAVGGVPDIVIDGETGLTVPVGDPAELAAAIRRLMDDDGLRDRLVAGGRSHVERHFDVRRNTATMLERIKHLVEERKARPTRSAT